MVVEGEDLLHIREFTGDFLHGIVAGVVNEYDLCLAVVDNERDFRCRQAGINRCEYVACHRGALPDLEKCGSVSAQDYNSALWFKLQ